MIFHEVLEEVSNRNKKVIDKDVVIEEDYSTYRSLRQGSNTQASNKGVLELEIANDNRWMNNYRTPGSSLTTSMVKNYSHISILLPTLFRYSQAL